jgi:hypothetical protein
MAQARERMPAAAAGWRRNQEAQMSDIQRLLLQFPRKNPSLAKFDAYCLLLSRFHVHVNFCMLFQIYSDSSNTNFQPFSTPGSDCFGNKLRKFIEVRLHIEPMAKYLSKRGEHSNYCIAHSRWQISMDCRVCTSVVAVRAREPN